MSKKYFNFKYFIKHIIWEIERFPRETKYKYDWLKFRIVTSYCSWRIEKSMAKQDKILKELKAMNLENK